MDRPMNGKTSMRIVIIAALAVAMFAAACGDDGGGGGDSGGADPTLVENPSGEQDASGYIGHNGATTSQDTSIASEGAASIRVAIPDMEGAGVQVWKADGISMTAVTAGVAYEFSADAQGDIGSSMRLELLWHDSDGAFLETSLGPVFFLPLGSFERFTFVAAAPEEAGLVVPQIVTDVPPGGPLSLWVDNVRLEESSTTDSAGQTPTPAP